MSGGFYEGPGSMKIVYRPIFENAWLNVAVTSMRVGMRKFGKEVGNVVDCGRRMFGNNGRRNIGDWERIERFQIGVRSNLCD